MDGTRTRKPYSALTFGNIMQCYGTNLRRVPARVLDEPMLKAYGFEVEPLYRMAIREAIEGYKSDPTGPDAPKHLESMLSNAPLVPEKDGQVLCHAIEEIVRAVDGISHPGVRDDAAGLAAWRLIGITAYARHGLKEEIAALTRQLVASQSDIRGRMIGIMKFIEFGDVSPKEIVVVDLVDLTKEELEEVREHAQSRYMVILADARFDARIKGTGSANGNGTLAYSPSEDDVLSHSELQPDEERSTRLPEELIPDALKPKPADTAEPVAPAHEEPEPAATSVPKTSGKSDSLSGEINVGKAAPATLPDAGTVIVEETDGGRGRATIPDAVEELDLFDVAEEVGAEPPTELPVVSLAGPSVTGSMVVEEHDSRALDMALLNAARNNDGAKAREALDAGASVDARNELLQTPLMLASFQGNNELVALLLKLKAEVNARDDQGNTALIAAAGAARLRTVGMLLQKGAKPEIKNKKGETARVIAEREIPAEKLHRMHKISAEQMVKEKRDIARLLAQAEAARKAGTRLEIIEPEIESVDAGLSVEPEGLGVEAGAESSAEIRLTESTLFALMVAPDEEIIPIDEKDIEVVEGMETSGNDEPRETTKVFRLRAGAGMQIENRDDLLVNMDVAVPHAEDGTKMQAIYANKGDVPQEIQALFPPEQPRWVLDDEACRRMAGPGEGYTFEVPAINIVRIGGKRLYVFDREVRGAKKLMAVDLEYEPTADGGMLNIRRKPPVGSLDSDKSIMEMFTGIEARSAAAAKKPQKERVGSLNSDDSMLAMLSGIARPGKGKGKKK